MTSTEPSNGAWPRVAHLVSLKNLGGVERYFARFLARHGNRMPLEILLQTPEIHPFVRASLAKADLRLHSIKGPGRWKIPAWLALRDAYQRRLAERLDPEALVVWNKLANNPLAMMHACPVFHYEHGTAWTSHAPDAVTPYLERVRGTLAVSHAARRMLEIRWRLPSSSPSMVLHNAIDLPDTASNHPEGRFRLGFAGCLKGLKAPMVALETFRLVKDQVPHAELWIAGRGPLESTLREWVKRWKLEACVTFCGLVDDMSAFYTELDAFICPSWREPFGLVAQEASAHGLPVVVSNVDGLPEALGDAAFGAIIEPRRNKRALEAYGAACLEGVSRVYSPALDDVVPAGVIDPEEAAQPLIAWANSPERRREMGRRARAWISREQNLERYGQRLRTFLRANL